MGSLGLMRGTNLLSSEIAFTDGASTSVQFDETYAPEIFSGACYLKGLYVTSWTTAIADGGINIQNGTSTTESSNTDIITLDLSTATSPGSLAKSFSFSGGLKITDGLHISATADLGGASIVKVRVLYEPVGGAGAAASVNLAAHQHSDMLVSGVKTFTDGASTTAQYDEAYSVAINDSPTLLHSLVITEWTGVNIVTDVGLRIQNGTSTTIASNTDLIELSVTTGTTGEDMTKSWDFPGGIYLSKGLHIGASADLGGNDCVKFQAVYEAV